MAPVLANPGQHPALSGMFCRRHCPEYTTADSAQWVTSLGKVGSHPRSELSLSSGAQLALTRITILLPFTAIESAADERANGRGG